MPAPANLVHELTASTGTGNLTTAGGNPRSFAGAFGTGGTPDIFDYFIGHQTAAEWERGTGHMSDATTMVRDTVIESSNSNNAVNFSAGTKDISNDVPAAKQIYDGRHTTLSGYGITDGLGQGYHTVNLLTAGMVKRTTNGATAYTTEKATNDVMVGGYEFSASVEQAIQIAYPTPKGMDGASVLKCKFYATTATAGTGNVIWGIRGRYVRDDDAIDGAWGTAAETTDAFLADGDQHISAEVTFTPGGTFGSECMLYIEVYRKAADGSDTYTQTMVLQAAMTKIPINAATDV